MTTDRAATEPTLRRYLLGELSEAEAANLEEKCFDDRELFDDLVAAQEELIFRYLRGQLDLSEWERFERAFLSSPRRRERVEFFRSLLAVVNAGPGTTTSAVSTASAPHGRSVPPLWINWGIAAVLLASVAWVVVRTVPPSVSIPRQTPGPDASSRPVTPEPSASPDSLDTPAPSAQETEVRVRLVEGTPASATPEQLVRMRPGTRALRLSVVLGAEAAESYAVTVRDRTGQELWNRSGLHPRVGVGEAVVSFLLPARALASGIYHISLTGITAPDSARGEAPPPESKPETRTLVLRVEQE